VRIAVGHIGHLDAGGWSLGQGWDRRRGDDDVRRFDIDAAVPETVWRLHGVPEVQGLLNGVRRHHVVVEEGVAHIVLKQGPQARSTARKRKMHDIGNKFVDGRHGTFFSGELAGELLPASFFFFSVA
jgi:hypothetical protein